MLLVGESSADKCKKSMAFQATTPAFSIFPKIQLQETSLGPPHCPALPLNLLSEEIS
jgi:hypothetical protein